MLQLLEWAIANSLTVLLLMPLVLVVGRISRQPAFRHGLWCLLLLKLVTPPLMTVDVTGTVAQWQDVLAGPSVSISLTERVSVPPVVRGDLPVVARGSSGDRPTPVAVLSPVSPWRRAARLIADWPWQMLVTGFVIVWGLGTILRVACEAVRLTVFARRLKRATRDSGLLNFEVDELRGQLGQPQAPAARLVEGVVSPMLWGVGRRAMILFPRELFTQLSPDARSTLLLHELAHYYRGDPWVRVLEFVTSALFWWHPAVWLARREIESAEEQCCDHWVMQRTATSPRCYADALLDTIDFLCERHPSLPPVASGLGNPRELRGRLVRIMQYAGGAIINPAGRMLLLGAACVLPLQPHGLAALGNEARDLFSGIQAVSSPAPVGPPVVAATDPGSESPRPPQRRPREAAPIIPALPPIDTAREPPPRLVGDWAIGRTPDGRFQVVALAGRRVELHNRDTAARWDLSAEQVASAAFLPGTPRLVTGGFDRLLRLWDAATGALLEPLGEHGDAIVTVAAAPSGDRVAAGSRDGQLTLRELSAVGPVRTWWLGAPVTCVRFHPNGRQLVAVTGQWRSDSSGTLHVIDPGQSPEVHEYPLDQPAGAVEFADAGDVAILGGWDGVVTYVRLADGRRLARVSGSKNDIAAAAFTPDAESFVPMPLAAALRLEELQRAETLWLWPLFVPAEPIDAAPEPRE
jgi:bla regulator protein blaR1